MTDLVERDERDHGDETRAGHTGAGHVCPLCGVPVGNYASSVKAGGATVCARCSSEVKRVAAHLDSHPDSRRQGPVGSRRVRPL